MFIRAIGIYEYDDKNNSEFSESKKEKLHSYKRINVAPSEEKSSFSLFRTTHPLIDLENNSLPHFEKNHTANAIYKTKAETGYHYIVEVSTQKIVVAISSKTKILEEELRKLIPNIIHAHKRPHSVKTTLNDIVKNPIGYTGKDLQIDRAQKQLDDIKLIMAKNMDEAIKRGQSLEELEERTVELEQNSVKFHKTAEKLPCPLYRAERRLSV